MDHPADIQLHAWAPSLRETFEQCALAMFGVMTDLSGVDRIRGEDIVASGHDLESLLYNFLDECLFIFSADPFLCASEVHITEFNEDNFSIKATLHGEPFDLSKHNQGTEVKAITYSNMQIFDKPGDCECFVIIDI